MINKRIVFWSVTSSLAGFLFGFDTIVISGAEQQIESIWGLSKIMHGLCMSAALWGTVLGALFGGWPTERFGRRQTLIWIGILYFVSAVGSGIAPEKYFFMMARFIGGLGVGIATVASPLYISEISPPHMRGRLTGMFQFNLVFGILIAFISNYLLGKYLDESIAWRWMLAVEAFPAFLYFVLCIGLSESPRWLITHGGNRAGGIEVFRSIMPEMSDKELEEQADEIEASVKGVAHAKRFFTRRLLFPITLAFLVAFFNQLSGINAVLYFAPRIFKMTGLDQSAALLQSVGIGITNLLFTFVGLYLIDRLGRRTLLYIGSVGYIVSLGLCAWAFFTFAPQFNVAAKAIAVQEVIAEYEAAPADTELAQNYELAKTELIEAASNRNYNGEAITLSKTDSIASILQSATQIREVASKASHIGGIIVLLCIFAFIASHAIGQGAVIWVFISEIFPNRNRAAGQALGCFTHWFFAALLTLVFPKMIGIFSPAIIFAFFSFMMVLQLCWVKLMVPETKGVPLEQMMKKLGIA